MGREKSQKTIRTLLDAGHAVLADDGPGKLTLDTVVGRARLSKGALLHHFRSKDDLLRRLLQDAIDDCNSLLDELRGADHSPGSFTRAYVQAFVERAAGGQSKRISAILAFLAYDDSLKALYAKSVREWSLRIEADGIDPATAEVVRLATDGLWWNEATEAQPLTPQVRKRFATMLMSMTHPQAAKRRTGRLSSE